VSLRVALLTPEHPLAGTSTGIGRYTAVLAGALTDAGHAVGTWVVGERLWRIDGTAAHDLGPGPRLAVLRPFGQRRLAAELRAFAPDVVEAPNWGGLGANVCGALQVVRLSTPILAIRPRDALRRATLPMHAAWERRAVRRAGLVIADSEAMRTLGARVYGRRAEVVIPHALAPDAPTAPAAGDDVLAVGRLEHRKGTDVLVCAWRRVHAQRPAARLHLVGSDGAGFGAAAIARWGGAGIVHHGHLADEAVAALAVGCGIQVVPSRYESFGLTVLEGWRAGLAVVASDAGALPEVVGNAGVLVPAGRPQPLAAALVALLDDPERRRELTTRGAVRLRSCFSPAGMAAASVAAYRRAIHRRLAGGWTSEPAS